MMRDIAAARIRRGLGFRPSGTSLDNEIISALQEAQRDLEKGKTLPRFLLEEDATLALTAGNSSVAKPTGFLRESDETRIRYVPTGTLKPLFLRRRYYIDAVETLIDDSLTVTTGAPRVYVMRKSTIDFIVTADLNYTLLWDYYKAADVLSSDIENAWLASAPEWLIGEAGRIIAMDLVSSNAAALVDKFTDIAKRGRSACFAEEVVAEQASAPVEMGANL